MKPTLATVLQSIPDRLFWSEAKERPRPAYNRIYVEVLRQVFELPPAGATLALEDLASPRAPNISSLQRAIANEAKRRRAERAARKPRTPAALKSEQAKANPPKDAKDSSAVLPLSLSGGEGSAPRAGARGEAFLALKGALEAILNPGLSRAFAETLETLPPDDPPGPESLAEELDELLADLPEALAYNEFLDVDLAEDLIRKSRRLIAATRDRSPAEWLLAAGAVRYLTDPDDASPDLTSSIGYLDDQEVLLAVAKVLGVDLDRDPENGPAQASEHSAPRGIPDPEEGPR